MFVAKDKRFKVMHANKMRRNFRRQEHRKQINLKQNLNRYF